MPSCPSIDWLSYFQDLNGWRQRDFEQALASRGISLGEYMEIVEHAAMDTCATAVIRDADTYAADDILPVASQLLSHYIRRKAQLISRVAFSGEASGPGAAAARRREQQECIHQRLEAIKAGRLQP